MNKSNAIKYQCRAMLQNFKNGLWATQPFLPYEKQRMGWGDTFELAWSFSEVEMYVSKQWENVKKKMDMDFCRCDNNNMANITQQYDLILLIQ